MSCLLQAAAADLDLKLAESEEAGRKAEAEMGGLRAKLAQADSAAKVRQSSLVADVAVGGTCRWRLH
jgi:hypothetical protein